MKKAEAGTRRGEKKNLVGMKRPRNEGWMRDWTGKEQKIALPHTQTVMHAFTLTHTNMREPP